MAFDWLTISFDLHDNKITKKPPGGGREAKNQPPFWTGGLGRFRKFGGCRRTGGYGRLRGQWVKSKIRKCRFNLYLIFSLLKGCDIFPNA